MLLRFIVLAFLAFSVSAERDCVPSLTTASGSAAPGGVICPGDLIFEDNFDFFDYGKWSKENTLSGGGVSLFVEFLKVHLQLKIIYLIELGVPMVFNK